jgi:hypothetical protein
MVILSDNDYASLKKFSLEELKKYREEFQEKLLVNSSLLEGLTGEQYIIASEEIDELITWINAYANEIVSRTCISTPPRRD